MASASVVGDLRKKEEEKMKREEKKKNTVPGDPLLKGDEAREDEVTHEQLQSRQHTVVEDARGTCTCKLGLGES